MNKYKFLLVAVLGLTVLGLADRPATITEAIQMLRDGPNRQVAREFLMSQQSSSVVPKLVDALRNDPGYRNSEPRSLAYYILIQLRPAELDVGRKQLLDGLKEASASIQLNCCSALLLTPISNQGEVVNSLIELLGHEATSVEVKTNAIPTLAKFGSVAFPALPMISGIFADTQNPANLRWAAAYAMLKIGGIESSLRPFRLPEHVNEEIVIRSLGAYGAETKGTFNTNAERRDECRRIVAHAVKDTRIEVRRAALESIYGVYGDDVHQQTDKGFVLNPELRLLLEEVSATDPDVDIRKGIAETLRMSEEVLKAKNALPQKSP